VPSHWEYVPQTLGTHVQTPVPTSTHVAPAEHRPLHSGVNVNPHPGRVVVVVLVVVVHPPHASQQLGHALTVPPCVVQLPASLRVLHRAAGPVPRQHATAPGRPHVDFAAQRLTVDLHRGGSWPPSARWRATPSAQRT
jgi:hypothetical protein